MNIKNRIGRPRKPGGKGATKHCAFGNCKNDSRKEASDYQFVSFPKPCLQVRKQFIIANSKHKSTCANCEKCNRWMIKCKRQDRNFKSLHDIKKDTYICTKHFVKPELADLYPDPLPEDVVFKLNNRSRKRKLSDPDSGNTKIFKIDSQEKNEVEAVTDNFVDTVEAAAINAMTDEVAAPTTHNDNTVFYTTAIPTMFCLKDNQVFQISNKHFVSSVLIKFVIQDD